MEFALGFLLACTVFHNARSFFKNLASVIGTVGKNFTYAALSDDGISVLADACVTEKLANIAQTCRGFVDTVFAFSRTEGAACNNNLGKRRSKQSVRIVKIHGNFAVGQRLALFRPAENKVIDSFAAQRTCILLAQNKAKSVRNVAFSATVGTQNTRNSVFENQFGFFCKRFEPADFKLCKLHLKDSLSKMANRMNRSEKL